MMAAREKFRFLDLSGYGFGGKHAVIDFCRELQGYYVEDFRFEFCLIRIQGGLLDLRSALVEDWSPIRSDAAIRRFRKVVRRVGSKNRWLRPSTWFAAFGMNYDDHYAGRFFDLSEAYVSKLEEFAWQAAWPYAAADWCDFELFWRKLKRLAGAKAAFDVRQCLAWPRSFDEITRDYLAELLSSNVPSETRVIVLHNAFEPFNPYRSLNFFGSAKCVIVDRDPRDNYVASLWYKPTRLPVEQFITRYRIYRQAAEYFARPCADVLRIRFEDLVLHYDETVARLLEFLGEKPDAHVAPRKYFDPSLSRKNVAIWKGYGDQSEIARIQDALGEYCARGAD